MNYKENLEEFYLIIPGKFNAIKVNNNFINIINSHYSKGSKFNTKALNESYILKFGTDYVGLKGDVLQVSKNLDDLDSLTVIEGNAFDKLKTKLKVLDGYLDYDLKPGTKENSLTVTWMKYELVSIEDTKELSNSQDINNDKLTYISTDGINLIDNSKFFYMLEFNDLEWHAGTMGEDNSLVFYCEDTENIKFKPKLIDEDLVIYSPKLGYLEFGKGHYKEDTVLFSKEFPKSPLSIIKTDKKGVYLLGNNMKYIKNDSDDTCSYSTIVKDPSLASEFNFFLINENIKDWY